MSNFDRSDFEAARPKPTEDDRRKLTMMTQAAVRADQLTGDPAWDTYASHVQSAAETAKKSRQAAIDRLANPQLVNPDQVAAVRVQVIRLDEQIRTLEWAIQFPKQIKALGEKAKDALDKMPALEEPQENAA